MTKFSILITTKNRLNDLKITLNQLACFIENDTIEFIICDDGSSDGTTDYIDANYKTIQLIKNTKSKGLIFCRNRLLSLTHAKYAITLDDDAHIVSENPLGTIETFFSQNTKCAVIAFRIFWGMELPEKTNHNLNNFRVKGYVGCGHVWRVEAWKTIPNYPDWFVFYGEEEYASYELYKKQWEIWFVPDVLVQHRVNVKTRKQNKDYIIRLRRSLRAGWYLYFLYYPVTLIPRRFFYTLWVQLKLKVFKGDLKALIAILKALFDVIVNSPKYINNNKRLSIKEFRDFQTLEETKIYWKQNCS